MNRKRAEKPFVVLQVRRRDLAYRLNEHLEDSGEFTQCRKFKPDDRRLTDKTCREYAKAVMAAIDAAESGGVDAGNEVIAGFLHGVLTQTTGGR